MKAKGHATISAKELWDDLSGWWVKMLKGGERPEYEEVIYPLVDALFAGEKIILDLGTGTGLVAQRLGNISKNPMIIGSDISYAQLSYAQRNTKGIKLVQHDAQCIPFADETFDAVVCSMVLEHTESLTEAMSEIARVTREGGVFLVFINHPIFQSPGSGPIEARSNHGMKWGIGDYLIETSELEEISEGKHVQFEHRMLGTYFNTFANNGFMIEQVIEKPVESDIPMLLITVCRKLLS